MAEELTPKQENFARLYVELGSGAEAYRQSYDAENMKPETLYPAASRVLADCKVSARVMELQEEARERHKVTVDSITAELDENRLEARAEKQLSAANAATLGKAKLHGLLIDRNETKHDVADPIKALMEYVAQNGKRLGT